MNKQIIFDMDGTILDTERVAMDAFKAAFNNFGYDADKDILRQSIGITKADTKTLFNHYFPGAPIDAILEYTGRVIRKTPEENQYQVKEGIIDLLENLKEKHCRLAIATSTIFKSAVIKIKQKNLLQYFDYIVGGDMVIKGKPSPDIFLLAAQKLGANPSSCIVFEDSGPGITAAHAAGMRVVYIKDITRPKKEILELCFKRFLNAYQVLQDIDSIIES